jgi:hypothetical protein
VQEISKYHPPCSLGVYDCERCLHPNKSLCARDLYFCRDDRRCPNYDLLNYHCCHGGGPSCRVWKLQTNFMAEHFLRKTFGASK